MDILIIEKPGGGWVIETKIDLGLNNEGEKLIPIFEIPIKPQLSVADDGSVIALIAYQSWYQFHNAGIEKAQTDFVKRIKEAFCDHTFSPYMHSWKCDKCDMIKGEE